MIDLHKVPPLVVFRLGEAPPSSRHSVLSSGTYRMVIPSVTAENGDCRQARSLVCNIVQ